MSDAPPPGMLVSEAEYELVSKALVAMAEQAKAHGETAAYAMIKRFVVRMKQHVFAGTEAQSETMQRLGAKVEGAFASGDYEAARVALVAMLAAIVRMSPDPAREIALHLAPMFVELTTASASRSALAVGSATLTKLHAKLKDDRAGFERDGWTDGPATFAYIHDLVDFCAAELAAGCDPFEEGPEETH